VKIYLKLCVSNIRMPLDSTFEDIKNTVCKKIGISKSDAKSFRITKKSIDARRKNNIAFVYSVLLETFRPVDVSRLDNVVAIEHAQEQKLEYGNIVLKKRPVIVGTGPCGLFAGLILSQYGFKPILLERGQRVDKRTEIVYQYWRNGQLNPETNVQFGEGGAGTFSDGKLTTRINDRRCEIVLKELHLAGAPEEILYNAKPHIGTDLLKKVVSNIRNKIIENGGEVRFCSKMTDVFMSGQAIKALEINGEDYLETDIVVLAIGHSARDTFEILLNKGIYFEQKPFSIGVRIEHPQKIIDNAQFGDFSGHPALGPADYQLFYKTGERTVYSFCMCPGGVVVASASEPEMIVTNGMSEYARDRENANSALVVSVAPGDFGSEHPLAGVEFQRIWERAAFIEGGNKKGFPGNAAPVQLLEDFINGQATKKLGKVKPSYTGDWRFADLSRCLPAFVVSSMKEAIPYFDSKIKGFGLKDAVLTGVETRTSSPVRILRTETLEAKGIRGLYPAGEGPGYAGGIMSAAVDGIRIAEQIIKTYRPL